VGPTIDIKEFGELNKRLPFYVEYMKNGVKVRLSFELDYRFIHTHTVLIFTDHYGRITYRPLEDGIKAAISN